MITRPFVVSFVLGAAVSAGTANVARAQQSTDNFGEDRVACDVSSPGGLNVTLVCSAPDGSTIMSTSETSDNTAFWETINGFDCASFENESDSFLSCSELIELWDPSIGPSDPGSSKSWVGANGGLSGYDWSNEDSRVSILRIHCGCFIRMPI